jgi:ribonuclease HII
MSITAASVLAKTYRDEYMNRIQEEYPMSNWKKKEIQRKSTEKLSGNMGD